MCNKKQQYLKLFCRRLYDVLKICYIHITKYIELLFGREKL